MMALFPVTNIAYIALFFWLLGSVEQSCSIVDNNNLHKCHLSPMLPCFFIGLPLLINSHWDHVRVHISCNIQLTFIHLLLALTFRSIYRHIYGIQSKHFFFRKTAQHYSAFSSAPCTAPPPLILFIFFFFLPNRQYV